MFHSQPGHYNPSALSVPLQHNVKTYRRGLSLRTIGVSTVPCSSDDADSVPVLDVVPEEVLGLLAALLRLAL